MSANYNHILDLISQLPKADQLRLIRDISNDLMNESDSLDIPAEKAKAWGEISRARAHDIKTGKVKGLSFEEFKKTLNA